MPSFEPVEGDPFAMPAAQAVPSDLKRVYIGNNTGPEPRFEPVDHDPFATDYGAIAKDIAKSTGVGIGKGVIALGGLAGDLTDLGAKGLQKASDFINDKVGLDRYSPPQNLSGLVTGEQPQSILNYIPTSASLTKNVEGVTGEFYKPQTMPGHFAETVGEFLPAALAGPGGLARKVGMQAVLPGVASEAAGQATQGTALEPYARAAGAIAGGVGGALLSQPSQTVKTIRQQFAEAGVTPQIVEDARKLMNSGVQLTWPEALSKVAGRPVLTDKLRVLESDPVTSGRMAAFFADRPQQVDAAGINAVSQIAPPSRNPYGIGPQVGKAAQKHIKDVREKINAKSDPYYKKAESELFSPQDFADLKKIPGYTKALAEVRKAKDAWRIAHLPDNSVGVLDKIKQHFHEQAENIGSKFNPQKSQSVRSSLEMSEEATRQSGIAISSDYEIALGVQRKLREKYLNPLIEGGAPLGRLAKKDVTTQKAIEALFPANPLPNSHNVIHDTVSALAKKNPGAASQLVRAHIESVFNEATQSLTGGPAQWGGAKFAAILTGNPQQRENLKAAITALHGPDAWRGLEGFLDAMEATGTRQAKGSLTAFNPDQLKSLSGSNFIGSATRLGASPGKWWKAVDDFWGNINKEKNMNTLADIFTDPKSAPVLKRIATMPTGSREAAYLASRLLLQSENSIVQPREARR